MNKVETHLWRREAVEIRRRLNALEDRSAEQKTEYKAELKWARRIQDCVKEMKGEITRLIYETGGSMNALDDLDPSCPITPSVEIFKSSRKDKYLKYDWVSLCGMIILLLVVLGILFPYMVFLAIGVLFGHQILVTPLTVGAIWILILVCRAGISF